MLRCENISKRYDNQKVLKDISMSFPKCGIVSIVGPSGSGKSTLLNILGGIMKDYGGTVYYNDKDIRRIFYRKDVSFIFQNIQLIMWLNVLSNISLSRYFYKGKFDKKSFKDEYNVNKISNLSLGQRQKVSFERISFTSSKILLCDEPTGSLDETNAVLLMKKLKKLSDSRLIILVSHDRALVEQYSDEIYIVEDGEIREHRILRKQDYIENNNKDIYPYSFSLLRLSFFNMLSHKSHVSSLILGLFITLLCIMLTFTLTQGLEKQIYDYIYSIVPSSAISFKMKDASSINETLVEEIKSIEGVERCHLFLDNYELLGAGFKKEKYKESQTIFIADDSLNYSHLNLIEGRYPINNNEVLLSSKIAGELTKNNEALMNKAFYVWYKHESKVIPIKYKIVGICDDQTLTNCLYQNENAYIDLLKEQYDYNDYNSSMGIIYIDALNDRDTVFNQLSAKFKQCDFLKVGESTYEKIKEVINRIEIVLSCFTFLSIFSSLLLIGEVMYLNVVKGKKDFMIMKCFGAKNRHLICLLLLEIVSIFSVSSILCVISYSSFISLFNMIMNSLFLNEGIRLIPNFHIIFNTMVLGFSLCMIALIPAIYYLNENMTCNALKE